MATCTTILDVTYRRKQIRPEGPGVTTLWTARESGAVLQVAVVETITLLTVFDNNAGASPFCDNLVFTGDKAEGTQLLQGNFGIAYTTPLHSTKDTTYGF